MAERGVGLIAAAAAALALAAPATADACSIVSSAQPSPPSDPRALFDDAQTVFEGRVASVEQRSFERRYTIEVDRVLRGSGPRTVHYSESSVIDSCWTRVPIAVGERHGFVDGEPVAPPDYAAALRPYPAAAGRGTAAVAVAGRFGAASLAVLDRGGRVLAYGFGGSRAVLAACPRGGRVVQAGSNLLVRRVRDMSVVRRVALPGAAIAARCIDTAGTTALLLSGRDGALTLAVVRGDRVRRVVTGDAAAAALGRGAALFALPRGTLVRAPYGGGIRVTRRSLPAGVIAMVASADLRHVLAVRPARYAELILLDRRTGRRFVRRLPGREDPEGFGVRVPETLAFDRRDAPLLGYRGRFERLDRTLRPVRLLGRGERFAQLTTDGAWGLDFDGRLRRGREVALALPRADAAPMTTLPPVPVDADPRVPSVL